MTDENNKMTSKRRPRAIVKNEMLGMTRKMNCGLYATVIDYITSKNITVRFEDGLIIYNTRKEQFMNGAIKHRKCGYDLPEENRIENRTAKYYTKSSPLIGMTKRMQCGLSATIINQTTNDRVNVRFEDNLTRYDIKVSKFLRGEIEHHHNKHDIDAMKSIAESYDKISETTNNIENNSKFTSFTNKNYDEPETKNNTNNIVPNGSSDNSESETNEDFIKIIKLLMHNSDKFTKYQNRLLLNLVIQGNIEQKWNKEKAVAYD